MRGWERFSVEDREVTRLFRFRRQDGSVSDRALADPDAACWAAPYFTLQRDGAEISRDLLAAAANSRLTAAAQFDTEDLRARLARGKLLGVSA